jgi:DICT domain-containing protein/signal transduction histidine kinase
MSRKNSVVTELLQVFPNEHLQMYFKSSLTALSHAMEDLVLAGSDNPLVIASFQRERFYRQEAHRYRRIGAKTDQVYVLAAPETDFKHHSGPYETIAFTPQDSLAQEWHLVVIGQNYANCLICREKTHLTPTQPAEMSMDNSRRFEGIWTFDPEISNKAAEILLKRILSYRPELKAKINQALDFYCHTTCFLQPAELTTLNGEPNQGQEQFTPLAKRKVKRKKNNRTKVESPYINPDPFVQRLVTYLQAGQYKLIKANKFLTIKEQKERLLNYVTGAIRRSLNPEEILEVAVNKLGEGLGVCRCVIYRCQASDSNAIIEHEFLNHGITSIKGQNWPLKNNPLFKQAIELGESLSINDVAVDPLIQERSTSLQRLVTSCSILSWLVVPILYQGKLLGMMELHHCGPAPTTWKPEDISLVDAIATSVGVALIQAESYANLEDLNEQLEALDRTRSNLVAITGHELRTPLSTIQICLESLANEPDMLPEMRQVMLNTALQDAERMRKLVQDFLTLSQLESGRVEWNPEPLSISECIELSLSHLRSRHWENNPPMVKNLVKDNLPLVKADGEWLVEVLTKLLDNACKFTDSEGTITINVEQKDSKNLEVTLSDNGRGIEPDRLDKVFDRFYQEEGALRRSTGGTGLGLAICRQIVANWGGKIWAQSLGKNKGSAFHFTVPIFEQPTANKPSSKAKKTRR